ncbi:hypothetical protein ACM614_10650, partial [Streptomyces sp. 12297]
MPPPPSAASRDEPHIRESVVGASVVPEPAAGPVVAGSAAEAALPEGVVADSGVQGIAADPGVRSAVAEPAVREPVAAGSAAPGPGRT